MKGEKVAKVSMLKALVGLDHGQRGPIPGLPLSGRTPHVDRSSEGKRSGKRKKTFLTMDRPEHHSIDHLKERGAERRRPF